ncbi:MAG: Ig-like domain-containing protein [bacterium]
MNCEKLIIVFFLIVLINACKNDTTEPSNSDKPTISIVSLTNGATVIDTALIQLDAKDDKGIVQVDIYIDNQLKKTITVPPFKWTFEGYEYPDNSNHSIYAKVYDGDENISSSTVLNFHLDRLRPDNFSAEFINDTTAQFEWSDVSHLEDGFEIEQSTDGQTFELIKTVSANVETVEIEGNFLEAVDYYFRIRAIKGTQKSIYSNVVGTSLTSIPPVFTISTISTDPMFAFAFYCTMDVKLFSYEVFNPLNQSYGLMFCNNYLLLVGQAYTDDITFPKLSGTWQVRFKGTKINGGVSFDVIATIQIAALIEN